MISELVSAVSEAWVEISFTLLMMSVLAAACILAAPDTPEDKKWDELG